jgi:Domain of unknown function (DUF4332)
MQLEHMEVSLLGEGSRQIVGPLSSGLNAIVAPRGSGKSRLVRWLRQMTCDIYGPNYVPTPGIGIDLQGSVELRNLGYPLRFSRDLSGRVVSSSPTVDRYTPARHNPAHFGHNDQRSGPNGYVGNSGHHEVRELTARQRQAFALLADVSESVDSEVALDEVARRLGLENTIDSVRGNDRELLVARERDLLTRLDLLQRSALTREQLVERRKDLEHQLSEICQYLSRQYNAAPLDRHRMLDRVAAIEADLQGAESETQHIDREIAKIKAELRLAEIGSQAIDLEPSYRQQLQQLEDRLSRWRKTLRDLKAHRESIEQDQTQVQLDQQMGTQLSGHLHADPRAYMRSLEAQIHHARKQLDELVNQYWPGYVRSTAESVNTPARGVDPRPIDIRAINPATLPGGYQVQRDSQGRAHISYDKTTGAVDTSRLPDMLRAMQRDLHDVCHQLSRQEAATAAEALKTQSQQLRRCETELLLSVEKLIEERGLLLRKIADRYALTSDQISLTFGDWCQCIDHPHLYDWLVKDEAPAKQTCEVDGQLRMNLQESLIRLQSQRREAALRAEECRRQLRDANRLPVSSPLQDTDNRQAQEAELLRELDSVINQLGDWDSRDRIVAELDEVRRLLAKTPLVQLTSSEYRQTVDRNIVGLSGSFYLQPPLAQPEFYTSRQYDTVNGVVSELPIYRQQYQVPNAIVRTAQRLSIAQLLANRGEPIPVILDETLDGLDVQRQHAAIAHLALAANRLQVIVLTGDDHLADLIGQHSGTVIALRTTAIPVVPDLDVNRHLAAVANEHETDKWFRPVVEPLAARPGSAYYLSDRSSIDAHPSINAEVAAGCRACRITSIGQLQDVDADWLSDQLGIEGVDGNRIRNWQAAADLLCSVRNLRPFDARVLVGAGIRSANQLSHMHPSQLVDRVERFFETDIGRRILRSGNRFENSRIHNWISAARSTADQYARNGYRSRSSSAGNYAADYDSDRDLDGFSHSDNDQLDVAPRNQRSKREAFSQPQGGNDLRSNSGRPGSRPTRRSQRTPFDQAGESPDVDLDSSRSEPKRQDPNQLQLNGRESRSDKTYPNIVGSSRATAAGNGARSAAKFYLELSSPIVDAPSIGERLAERLMACNIRTVADLLGHNAESLAQELGSRRINVDIVRTWQDQARLVCRIPFIRGHDAQMLVACGITSPEALLNMKAESVLAKVLGFAQSSDGQRVLRGSKEPDLAEVQDWLKWARQCRNLNAA